VYLEDAADNRAVIEQVVVVLIPFAGRAGNHEIQARETKDVGPGKLDLLQARMLGAN
jgi:hypothetical protein